ncbi:MAG: glycine zipper 2TM domain-containing protein [Brevundimonas sp.]
MFARPSMKTVALGAAALSTAALLLAPATASAQAYSYQGDTRAYAYGQSYGQPYGDSRYNAPSSYGYQDRGYADNYCRTDRGGRQAAGVAIGATIGAVAGSQVAARGRRTEGSILGGVLGAIVGAGVSGSARDGYATRDGYSTRDCGPSGYDYRYDQSGYGYQTDRYDDRSSGYDRSSYGYQTDRYDDRYDDRSRAYQGADSYGCRTVAVRVRDGYGRLVTRYEQSCPNRY